MGSMLVAACGCLLLLGGTVTEPSSKIEFPEQLQLEQGTVACTGVNIRTKYMVKVYAIAHYAAPEAPAVPDDPKQRLQYWPEAKALKAFVLRFTYNVSQEKIRGAWEEGLDNAKYTGPSREGLIGAFTQDLKKGDEIRFVALPDGTLLAQLNGTALGSWKDPDLVKAMWNIWMGPKSVLSNKENLVQRPVK